MTRTLYDLCGRDERLRFSPYCWRVKLALAHKGLKVTAKPWRFQQKEALAFADYDKVPVLCDGDTVVTDSFEILRYLDATYPDAPLLGEGMAYQRALLIKSLVDRSVNPALVRIIILDLLDAIHPDDRAYFRESRETRFGNRLEALHDPEAGWRQLATALAPMRDVLAQSDFLDGEAPAGADYLLMGSLMWAHVVSRTPLWADDGPVAAWFERMLKINGGVAGSALTVRHLG
ncbi:glutathione S-transferase N-terminal domain-containing protein [Halomonas dongshanensis]|uniref:Glutathione S-transferase N-terminal domain-containing protein n=1 Tax=Halomonas dongshanensis TaxID=2890835 RepID=A0ABT2EDY8_9GAMM|nr:glutathione S-transferase N-terminal domain-containing protein [Halomonas dongshanensis]MCS2609812.1 glutathione S-transferase N-terminal domain-containing protein [Halomonas dongshanensis]